MPKLRDFQPATALPDLSGKVVLITGGTGGIGAEVLKALAPHNPALLFFAGRNKKAADGVAAELATISPNTAVVFLECDLGKVSTVRSAAELFLKHSPGRLDIFIANAGTMATSASLTADGHETQWGSNFVGNAVLFKLLLPTMLHTASRSGADVRLLMATSQGYAMHPRGGILFDSVHTPQQEVNTWLRYGQAKLAAVLWAREVARRYPQILTASVHPGTIRTALIGNLTLLNKFIVYATNSGGLTMLQPHEGAYNLLWCATAPREELESGEYYEPVGVKKQTVRDGTNEELAGRLWQWVETEMDLLGVASV